ncbi:MAG: phospholipid ABC transporter ATP-binding protein MlaF [Moraxellaceae bacterium]|nr:MAG: phospholipid ABC transporter ATP-binding protein MlaF [Moraxellaceae bacterium]
MSESFQPNQSLVSSANLENARLNLIREDQPRIRDAAAPEPATLNQWIEAEAENYVEIQNLSFQRGSRIIYDDLTMSFPKGKVTAVMGPSGTGKTTLLKLMGGQLQPTSGSIIVAGVDVARASRTELFDVRKRMGMLFQSGALFSDLSVYENVAFPLRAHTELPEDMIRDIVLMKLHSVGLRGARELMPSELSGGMARRVALARAIVLDPEMVMYDEPFTGQDPISMSVLLQLIRLLNDTLELTSIIVSHDVQETLDIADYLYIIADGRVIGQGEPKEVMNSDSALVQQFMLGLPDGPVPFHFPSQNYRDDILEGRH